MKASEYFRLLAADGPMPPDLTISECDALESLILSHLEAVEKAKTGWVSKMGPSSFQPCYEEREFVTNDKKAILASALRLKEVGDEARKEKP